MLLCNDFSNLKEFKTILSNEGYRDITIYTLLYSQYDYLITDKNGNDLLKINVKIDGNKQYITNIVNC